MEILIAPEVATELRVSETHVYRLIRDKHLKSVRLGPNRVGVTREALDAFILDGGIPDDAVLDGTDFDAAGAPSETPAPAASTTKRRRSSRKQERDAAAAAS